MRRKKYTKIPGTKNKVLGNESKGEGGGVSPPTHHELGWDGMVCGKYWG
jgi:hypothetical protein